MMKPKILRYFAVVLVGVMVLMATNTALAQSPAEENEACLTCHVNPDIVVTFSNGDTVSAHVSRNGFQNSAHGDQEMTCGGCHPDRQTIPHKEISIESAREYTLALNDTCLDCHPDQASRVEESMHSVYLREGRSEAAVCVDCHGAHTTESLRDSRADIATACRQCHSEIYDEYRESVHGAALADDGNQDVPSCVDCHGEHTISDPHTVQYRNTSPEMCGGCHANAELMSKYDISTNVFQSYVADFHGSTVTLFERESPDLPSNKAVCYDCHGIHNIKAVDDPNATIVKENLQETCRKCHPDATTNFPQSWTSHYDPTFDKQPLVAVVNLFYRIAIPGIIGFMGLFVVTDAGRTLFGKKSSAKNTKKEG